MNGGEQCGPYSCVRDVDLAEKEIEVYREPKALCAQGVVGAATLSLLAFPDVKVDGARVRGP